MSAACKDHNGNDDSEIPNGMSDSNQTAFDGGEYLPPKMLHAVLIAYVQIRIAAHIFRAWYTS